jgi:glycerophosphoryl diester phosphodiesterase
LDEIVASVASIGANGGHVQLDVKLPGNAFDDRVALRLRATLHGMAPAFILGTTDAKIFGRVRNVAPELPLGFDPLDLYESTGVPTTAADFEELAEATLRLGPGARIYYLEADLVLAGLNAGVNLIERVAASGAEVDAWTVDPDRPRLSEDLRRLLAAGVHQVTTNDSEALEPILRELA